MNIPNNQTDAHYLGYLLNEAAGLIRRETALALAPFKINPRLFGVLDTISKADQLSQRALGVRRGIDRTTTVAFVDALEKQGLIERTANPKDRREHHLILTAQGKTLLKKARVAVRAVEEKFIAELTREDREKLFEILQDILHSQNDAAAPFENLPVNFSEKDAAQPKIK